MEYIMGMLFTVIMGTFAYGSFHVAEEQRQGKRIPLFWEKE